MVMYKRPHRPACALARTVLVGALLATGLAGCAALGPNYQRPTLDVPGSLPVPASTSAGTGSAQAVPAPVDLPVWWQAFQDPILDTLLAEAAQNNQDLLLAAGRIVEARANEAIANANRFPAVDATAGASRSRSRASQSTARLPPGAPAVNKDFQVGLNASYEIDFWGKFSRADEAARARLLSQQANRGVVLTSLHTSIVQNYFALRAYDAQLALAVAALQTRQENLRLQRKRFAAGSVGTLEMHQAESEVAGTEVTRAQAQQAVAVTEAALAVLAGRSPRAIATPQIARGAAIDALYGRLTAPVDLPADLLNRRPDIVAAEQALVAANADIGQARAQYFPSIRLTTGIGYESNVLKNLISPESLLWNLGASLAQPVFRAGAIGAVVQSAEARKAQAQYVQTVENAFRDVHDAITALSANELIYGATNRRAKALKDTLRLATLRYDNGYSSYLEVLTAQRDLLQTQASVIDVQRAHMAAAVGLYRAVGGGWDSK